MEFKFSTNDPKEIDKVLDALAVTEKVDVSKSPLMKKQMEMVNERGYCITVYGSRLKERANEIGLDALLDEVTNLIKKAIDVEGNKQEEQ